MVWFEAGALMIGMIVALLFLTVPVAFAFLIASTVGVLVFIGGDIGIKQLTANASTAVTSFTLVPVPLFILMGELFFHTGVARRVFDGFDVLFGRVPGRLSYLTVSGGTMMAALSGSSIANTAMLGATMVPEMMERGYKKHMALGPILGTGGLAMIIPPSALAVLLGSIARIDIGRLLIAGLLPGVLLALMYAVVIYVCVRLDPEAAPLYDVAPSSLGEKLVKVTVNLLPMSLVVFLVVGLIILGVTTPSEAAAFGVLGVLILAAAFRSITWDALVKALAGTLRITAMVFLIIVGSATFSQILAMSGATAGLLAWVIAIDIPPLVLLGVMFVVLLFLGMLMEQLSIMMLTVPLFFPLAHGLGYDPVWFGVIMLLALEISLATPPFGLGLFVLIGVAPAGTRLGDVAWAALPYISCAILLVALLVAFPSIALFLPSLM